MRILAIAVVCASQSRVSRLSRARPCGGEGVVLRAAIVLGDPPVPRDQPVPFQPSQRREERPGVDLKGAPADLFEAYADAVAVERFERQRLQDQHVQRALDEPARL